jgi:pimeloyl-ACP methyl ester carboxylesterase
MSSGADARWREQRYAIDGPTLNAAIGPGAGPPLVFLHGVSRRWQDAVPLAAGLAGRWQPWGLDLRGHGSSARCPGAYLVRDYVGDVVRFLRAHVPEPAVLYGHSLGAMVAAGVAAELPRHVRAIILEDPPGPGFLGRVPGNSYGILFAGLRSLAGSDRPTAETARLLAELPMSAPGSPRTVRLGDVRDATSIRFMARCLRDLDPEVLTPLLEARWLEGLSLPDVYGRVRCPALVLAGDEKAGGMLPADEAAALAGAITDCTRIDFPGVGHLLHWMQTERTLRHLHGFLEAL